jgi:hypothetical protein
MAFKGRLQRIQESLEANKRFFLWLDHAKAAGRLRGLLGTRNQGTTASLQMVCG